MAPPLKVFRAHLGFYDSIIAVSSQKKAIEAWGASPAEFAHGFAAETHDTTAVEAAMRQPGVVLRRPFGSKEAFAVEPATPVVKALPRTKFKADADRKRRADAERRKKEEKARQTAQKALDARLQKIDEQEKKLAAARETARAEYASRLKKPRR
jgi:flagellar motility protein MotE (MotC chaperone)